MSQLTQKATCTGSLTSPRTATISSYTAERPHRHTPMPAQPYEKHCGPTNVRLRVHVGIAAPSGAGLRVGNETREWINDGAIIFDDSFEHEVVHEGASDRIVLICDIWHPELDVDASILPQCSPAQVEAIQAARAGKHLPRRRSRQT